MNKITSEIAIAFNDGNYKSVGNTFTDGNSVYLHGNKIVERREDGIYATLAGWNTSVTRERVNGITGAGFHQVNNEAYLNDEPCDSHAWYRIQ